MVKLQISQNQDWKLEDIRGFNIGREGNVQLIFKSLINLSIKYKGRIYTSSDTKFSKVCFPCTFSQEVTGGGVHQNKGGNKVRDRSRVLEEGI